MRYVSSSRSFDQHGVDEMAARAATGLADLGVGDGDAVGLLMVNEIEVLACTSALALLGAHPVPIGWHSTPAEVAYITGDAQLAALLCHDVLAPVATEAVGDTTPLVVVPLPAETAAAMRYPAVPSGGAQAAARWEDWQQTCSPWSGPPRPSRPSIIYTSGTTGKPKGVLRQPHDSDEARAMQARSLAEVWGAEPGMRTLVMAPLYHSAPAAYVRAAMAAGGEDGELHFLPRFDAETALRMIQEHRISHMWMVPTMFIKLLQLPDEVRSSYDVSSVGNIIHSGAPCPVGIKHRMIEWLGPVVNEFYGSTEVGPVTYATSADWLARPGTVGQVLEGCSVATLDDAGRPNPPGVVGEIAAANSTYASFTYHNRQHERDELDADGGLILTGDIGVLDEDGHLFLKDRKKDLVISGGVNLYPAEVEDVLLQLDNVRDGAAFGVPDEVFGERLVAAVALVSPEPGAPERLRTELAVRLSGTKVPREIHVIEDFPRSAAGKVAKNALRALFG